MTGPPASPDADSRALAGEVVSALARRGETVAVAESLTGGLLAAALVQIPGASQVFRGGIVAYATDLKATLLGVPRPLLDRYGAVHADVAAAMASGVRGRLDATFGVSTTGVAGPDPADGQPVGTVHIAVSSPQGVTACAFGFAGDRAAIRQQTVVMSLKQLKGTLEGCSAKAGPADPPARPPGGFA